MGNVPKESLHYNPKYNMKSAYQTESPTYAYNYRGDYENGNVMSDESGFTDEDDDGV
jgi:hypothetical protein